MDHKIACMDGIELDGLDVAKGISMAGGTVELYLNTLAMFHKDALIRISEITNCLASGNLPLYTVHVHALKSASANVGAEGLSKAAHTLEAAGNHNNIDFVKTRTAAFIAELQSLLTKVNALLILKRKPAKEKDCGLNMEDMDADLVILKTAIREFDAGTMNETIARLEALTQEYLTGNVIENIADNVLIAEYDKAIELIDSLLNSDSRSEG